MTEPAELLRATAHELGFDWFALAPAEPLPIERGRLEEWLAAGQHGAMEWLATHVDRRTDPTEQVRGCRTVIIVGMNYLRPDGGAPASERPAGQVSRYARTRDYHRVIEVKLEKLSRRVRELFPGSAAYGSVDYGPVMERPWAARGGLGFIGKHTLLIHPEEGSFHFLGAVLTTANIPHERPAPLRAGCGDCRRCIDACPTQAITEPFRLDASRCLSYLTIEAPEATPKELWPHYGDALFGCDICQDVCPYNQKRARPVSESPLGVALIGEYVPLVDLIRDPHGIIDGLGPSSSPLRRAGPWRLARNAAIIATQQGDGECHTALEALTAREDAPAWLRAVAGEAARQLGARLSLTNR